MKLFQKELAQYPTVFYKKSRIKAVVLVQKLFYKEIAWKDFYDWSTNIIFLTS